MDKSNDEKGLLDEFSVPSYDEWLSLVNEQLKGAPFEKKLVKQTVEGISIQPIYLRQDVQDLSSRITPPGQFPFIRGTRASGNTSRSWSVSQPFRFPLAGEFNEVANRDLARGLTSLQMTLDDAGKSGLDPDQSAVGTVGSNGLSIVNQEDVAQALNGINLTVLPVQLEGGMSGASLLLLLLAYCRQANIPFEGLKGSMVFDPMAELATSGSLPVSLSVVYDRMATLVGITQAVVPGLKSVGIDGRPYCEGGGSAAQELGFAMATAVETFRELQQRGVEIDDYASAVSFSFATGSDFFLEIAKLRAARYLWARIIALLGGSEVSQKVTLHSVSACYNKTIYDPYVNMLRTTTEAFSAVIGGTDVLSVVPFDDLFGLPDETSRRTARNLQIVLKEECHGNRVIDPAGGSWFVENLTDSLGESAWSVFQEVEKAGGMAAALKSGLVQKAIAEIDQQRRKKLGQRKDVAVGTNMYANLTETLPEVRQPDYESIWEARSDAAKTAKSAHTAAPDLEQLAEKANNRQADISALVEAGVQAAAKGATLGELTASFMGKATGSENVTPITIQRRTAAYETLRQKSAEMVDRTGKAPTVFFANMGPLRQHKARADFSAGFFQPGGFSVISPDGFDSVEDAVAATLDSGALIAVVCSTDDSYPDLVPPFVEQIKQKKPDITVIVAGYPKDYVTQFQELGVDDFIHIKADNLQILTNLQAKAVE